MIQIIISDNDAYSNCNIYFDEVIYKFLYYTCKHNIREASVTALNNMRPSTLKTTTLISILVVALQATDYNIMHTPNCHYIKGLEVNSQMSYLWNMLILHQIDQYCFYALCPAIFIAQILILLNYYKHPSLLIKPGNIFCGLIIIEVVLNLSLLINGIYHGVFSDLDPMPDSFPSFCEGMSFIFVFFQIIHFFYLGMYFCYIILMFRFSLKKKPKNFWRFLHAIVILLSVGLTLLLYFDEFLGLGYYGICQVSLTMKSVKWNQIMPWVTLIIGLIFASGGIFTLIYFRKHIPKVSTFRRRKASQSRTISMLVIGFTSFLIFQGIVSLVMDYNCINSSPSSGVTVLVTFANIARLLQYIFLIIIILRNGQFRQKLKKTFRSFFQKSERPLSVQQEYIDNNFQIQELAFNEKLLVLKEKSNEIDLLRVSQIYTIISGIYIAHYQYHRSHLDEQLRGIHFKEKISFFMDNYSVMNYEKEARVMLRLKILDCLVELHSPRVFNKMLNKDGLQQVFRSFTVLENSRKIWNLAEGSGGKSGQFFFFSTDNKYVLKTITQEEFDFLMQHLQSFIDHYEKHPKSLLAKIYGVFTIRGNQIQRSYRLILMKNILGCTRSQVLRIYDMKGSTHDRQVINKQIDPQQVSHLTLKDKDFLNLEERLKINQLMAKQLRQTLHQDSQFLKNLNLIDYSLLVVRVNWEVPCKQPLFWGQLQRIQHAEILQQYYHIGVIDYMQKWDLQKKGEKWWKNFTGKKDISAQEPKRYKSRFVEFIDEITLEDFRKNSTLKSIQLDNLSGLKSKKQEQNEVEGIKKQVDNNNNALIVPEQNNLKQQKKTRDSSDLRPDSKNFK